MLLIYKSVNSIEFFVSNIRRVKVSLGHTFLKDILCYLST